MQPRKYVIAHPESELARNLTRTAGMGWLLVAVSAGNYPIFRETRWRWFKRVVLRRRCYVGPD